jgi:hypothetical protein
MSAQTTQTVLSQPRIGWRAIFIRPDQAPIRECAAAAHLPELHQLLLFPSTLQCAVPEGEPEVSAHARPRHQHHLTAEPCAAARRVTECGLIQYLQKHEEK